MEIRGKGSGRQGGKGGLGGWLPWIVLPAAIAAAYVKTLRPWHMTWGATPEESARTLPGDELVPHPRFRATHAITIEARPEQVWPWLVQMGQGRGGLYSYDWLENLGGLDFHSADSILPQFQELQVGDVFPLAPDGFGPVVSILKPNRAMVLHGDTRVPGPGKGVPAIKPGDYLAVVWGFYLETTGPEKTRLVERFLLDYNPSLLNTIFYRVFLEPGSFIMEREMLRGIRTRAERR